MENTVACALQKEIHYKEDCFGESRKLYYLKNREGKEIDFCVVSDEMPTLLLEVKWKDEGLSSNFNFFEKYFSKVKIVQLSKEIRREKTFPGGPEIRAAHNWLSTMNLP